MSNVKERTLIHIPTKEQIIKLSKKYGIIRISFYSNVIYMSSALDGKTVWDEWYCKIKHNKIKLYHNNKLSNKNKWHFQSEHYCIKNMFAKIHNHSDRILYHRGEFSPRLQKSFDMIYN